ncbi:MAG TPA: acetyl-CoA carboxylase biotin carboxyl carrier protein subunit, partial [Albitalea sp.]|nr:acetyl-CoA carboxylase biotin carboxyl carrier protein subunit [Albitalea sp.]
QQIKAFIDAMAASDLHELEVSHEGWTLRLVRGEAAARGEPPPARPPLAAPAVAAAPAGRGAPEGPLLEEIRAPMFGVVHLGPAPGEPPFVAVGQAVKAGQTLCVIEAMKVFNEVRAERDATLQAVLVTSGQEVEAGQPLLRFE